jgi:exodeoxyribonuclease VII large subunit
VGHEIDTSLADFAADLRAPTPSAAAEIVSFDGEELEHSLHQLQDMLFSSLEQKTERIRLLLDQFKPVEMERNFRMLIQPFLLRLDDGKEGLLLHLKSLLAEKHHTLELLSQSLSGNSPFEILNKGYAVVSDSETGSTVTAASQTEEGRRIRVRFARDGLEASVNEIQPEERKE